MFSAVYISETQIAFDREALIEHMNHVQGKTDVVLQVPSLQNHLLIPFLAYIYTFCYGHFPQVDVDITFAEVAITPTSKFETVTLEPFLHNPVPTVCFGGTFDRMHNGHKLLISAAVLLCQKELIIGVTRKTSQKAHSDLIQPFHQRASNCIDFIFKLNQNLICRIEVLDDVAGPAGTIDSIDLLVVSQESIKGGEMVAQIREERHLKPIECAVVPLVTRMTGSRLSSSHLRELLSSNHGAHEDQA